jgi:pyruvate formate lyase activating enzyme
MPFYKVTYSAQYRRATVHNHGCNFRCVGCAYKIKPDVEVGQYPSLAQVQEALRSVDAERDHFMGGEPTTCADLPAALRFCQEELGLRTYLGHTNGWAIPLQHLNGANVSFKAHTPAIHESYTGRPAGPVYESFRRAHDAGLELKASCVSIPGLVDLDEVGRIAAFVASCSPAIPFHIMGYIPIPGTPWPRPTDEQMAAAVAVARQHVQQVGFSHLTLEQAQDLGARDDRFQVERVL